MRRTRIAALAMYAALSVPPSAGVPVAATVCAAVADCLSRARQLAHKGDGISPEQDQLADRLRNLDGTAIEPLLVLLDDADEGMRKFAGYVLREMPGLGPHHLPRLARALERDPGWLPLAVAKIGTPDAIHVLVDALRRVGDGKRDQIRFALEAIGPRAFPDLLLLFNCGDTCDESLLRSVGTILAQERERASDAVDPLVAIADDSLAPLVSRRCAIAALGGLRATADPAVDVLVKIARRDPAALGSVARQALLQIGGTGATAALVSAVDSPEPAPYRAEPGFERRLVLRDIAELGYRGAGAGPTVERYLRDTDPDLHREVLSYDAHGEHTTRGRVSPQLGIRLVSGWLVGADRGEFGGELVFERDGRASAIVLQQNVHGIHQMPDGRIVVATGSSHLLSNAGALYLVACDTERCRATRWKRLPGAPSDSWQTRSGELIVNTLGGSIVVSADGALRMADCHQH